LTPKYGIKNLLVRNLEHLSQAQFAKVTGACRRTRPGRRSPPPGSARRNSATR